MLSDERAAASLFSSVTRSSEGLDGMLQTLFHISPLAYAISTAGPHSVYVRVNQAYMDLVGMNETALVGRKLSDVGMIVDGSDRASRLELLNEVGYYSAQSGKIRHRDGREITVMISARRITIGNDLYDLEALTDVTEQTSAQIRQEEALRAAAVTDSLTGLPNRLGFEQRISHLVGEQADQREFGLAIFDLNGFKKVNDMHGHPIGDELLASIGQRMLSYLKAGEFVSRLGGDEFALLFQSEDSQSEFEEQRLEAMLDTILAAVTIGGNTLRVGAALGYGFASEVNWSKSALIALVDRRMYHAKLTRRSIAILGPPDLFALANG
jgi:diguanylate cyclase (GGDEF)-like protein/PAS domain S-box-containing protein